MPIIPDHHDGLFKKTEEVLNNAVDFIKGTLPQEITQNIDFSTLELDKTEYRNEILSKFFSDLVYNCEYKGHKKIKITLLFEHKSSPANFIQFQILKYMINIWEKQLSQNKELTPVIPIIFYHGQQKWQIKSLHEYFPEIDATLLKFIPQMDLIFENTVNHSDDEIINNLFSREANKIMYLLLKHFHEFEYLEQNLLQILELGKDYFNTEEGFIFLQTIISYLLSSTELTQESLQKYIGKVSKNGEEYMMTAALQLQKEGEYRKALDAAIKMLKNGVLLKDIAYYTSLSIEELERLKQEIA